MKLELSPQIKKVFSIIKKHGGEARFVGGAVRDFLLFNKPLEFGDIDIAVNLKPEIIAEIFKKAGAKVVSKYATNIIVLNDKVCEITSTRKDENCNGRHANMVFTPSFEEDSNRRDFTINALYLNEEGKIFDFHQGMQDLKIRRVRFIGNPEFRIEEDYLRIWRFFRFTALYGEEIDEQSFLACKIKKDSAFKLSNERITTEILKLFTASPIKIDFIIKKMLEIKIINNFKTPAFFMNEAFFRLLSYTNAEKLDYLIYTKEQTKFINYFKTFLSKLKIKEELLFLFYTSNQEFFLKALELSRALFYKIDFEIPSALPFTVQDILKEGFTGKDIKTIYEQKIKLFIKNYKF